MTYTKTVWQDRVVSTPNKYTKSSETSTSVTLVADPGTVTQTGTPINAANLNKMEQGIDDAHTQTVMIRATVVTNQDWNTLITPGIYQVAGFSGGSNAPSAYNWGQLVVTAKGPNVTQLYLPDGKSTDHRIYTRSGYDVTNPVNWGSWTYAWDSNFLRVNVDHLEWWTGSTWQGVGGVKSIQKGTATIPNSGSAGTVNVTISAVVTSKSIVHITSINYSYVDGGTTSHYINPSLTTSTNIAFSHTAISGGTILSWEVVEYF